MDDDRAPGVSEPQLFEPDLLAGPAEPSFTVEVVRSKRRRKTVQALHRGDVVRISIPANMSKAEEAHWVEVMTERMRKRARAESVDLTRRVRDLCAAYDLRRPTSVRWADNQQSRWGSCTPSDGAIRVSSRLAAFPRWVLDYVLVHELAHLSVFGHGPEFDEIVNRYPLAERARGFLMAIDLTTDGGATPACPSSD
ncbi:MAG TPA: M48 family metallopeptidase [Acidimicrobiales bacterium]|nr:M48 family metallopeptidase [Acidimicrobiales bacterium]